MVRNLGRWRSSDMIGLRENASLSVTPSQALALGLKRGVHSEKPEDFARMIAALYPNPPRIELFARTRRDGWDSWGDEPAESEFCDQVWLADITYIATAESWLYLAVILDLFTRKWSLGAAHDGRACRV
jgi:hypothetical protein